MSAGAGVPQPTPHGLECARPDGYTDVNAVDFFREVMEPGPAVDRQTRVVSIVVSGTAASAILEIDYPTFTFVDFMTLLKFDDGWKIVSKAFYQRMRPTPEAGS